MKKQLSLLLVLLTFTTCQNPDDLLLHVPSPAWEDQVVYFIMTDRFFDGNPDNNELGQGEYDPENRSLYNGGDLTGIVQQLDYLQELGATAIWITPPVLNQVWNPEHTFTGYHGYWASDFEKVDPHYGNLEDYKRLSDALHRRGMYLIQDVVTNHTGDYFRYPDGYDTADVTKNYVNFGAPEQSPFHLNDPRDPAHLAAGIYHFTPTISDYQDPSTKLNYQLSNLDDLNTENPVVIEKLIQAYQYWIQEVGVDGYRFDTAVYVDHEFWHRFLHGGQGGLAGIYPFAKKLGKTNFYTFGETWMTALPNRDNAEIELKTYLGTAEKPEMDAVLNFPLQQSIRRVFADGAPTAQMTYRLRALQKHFPKTTSLVNFIDNHDMARFRASASEAAYQQAMLFLMTMPGMPVIYQGTEQGETETRDPLFDKLDTQSSAFLFVKKLIALRNENEPLRRGKVEVLADSEYCPGLLLYRLERDGQELYVVFNTSENPILTGGITISNDLDINGLEKLFSLTGGTEILMNNGKVESLLLPPKEGLVFGIKEGKPRGDTFRKGVTSIGAETTAVATENIQLHGNAGEADSVFVFLDGNFGNKTKAVLQGSKWRTGLDLKNTPNGQHFVQAAAMSGDRVFLSEKTKFTLALPEVKRADVSDPIGDDLGPKGKYEYPADPTFGRQMDMKSATVHSTGNNFRLDVEMAHPFSAVWNPINGFDHLHLMVFIDLPGREGLQVLPKLNTSLPAGGEWDVAVTANGWSLAMFGSEGSTAGQFGTTYGEKPVLEVLPETNTLQFQFSASSLGNPVSLDGVKIHLYTWDIAGEGELRPLEREAKPYVFGGGNPTGPKFMDELHLEIK